MSGKVVTTGSLQREARVDGARAAQAAARDPEIASHLHPQSLRALCSQSKVKNAVHCTDLPEDGPLEVDYFFSILA